MSFRVQRFALRLLAGVLPHCSVAAAPAGLLEAVLEKIGGLTVDPQAIIRNSRDSGARWAAAGTLMRPTQLSVARVGICTRVCVRLFVTSV